MVKAVTPIPFVKARFFDRCGKPLAGGKVYTYEANTTTPKVTYKDPYGLTPNTNPIILDAAGEADIYLDGTYRIRITDRNDVLVNDVEKIGSWFSDNLQDTLDNISVAMNEALKPILQNLDDAINTAAAAGAGANGWTSELIEYNDKTQKQFNDNINGLASVSDMLAIANPYDGQRVNVKSYHENLGMGGGSFIWLANSTAEDDGGIVFAKTGVANGRWVRQYGDYITPEMFGAKGDKAHNDYTAWQSCLKIGGKIYARDKAKYLIYRPDITTHVDTALLLAEKPASICCDGICEIYFKHEVTTGSPTSLLARGVGANLASFKLNGINFFGHPDRNHPVVLQRCWGVNFAGVDNFDIERCSFSTMQGRPLSIGNRKIDWIQSSDLNNANTKAAVDRLLATSSTNGRIKNIHQEYFASAGMAIFGGNNIVVDGVTTLGIENALYKHLVWTDDASSSTSLINYAVNKDIHIKNVNGNGTILLDSTATGSVSDCHVDEIGYRSYDFDQQINNFNSGTHPYNTNDHLDKPFLWMDFFERDINIHDNITNAVRVRGKVVNVNNNRITTTSDAKSLVVFDQNAIKWGTNVTYFDESSATGTGLKNTVRDNRFYIKHDNCIGIDYGTAAADGYINNFDNIFEKALPSLVFTPTRNVNQFYRRASYYETGINGGYGLVKRYKHHVDFMPNINTQGIGTSNLKVFFTVAANKTSQNLAKFTAAQKVYFMATVLDSFGRYYRKKIEVGDTILVTDLDSQTIYNGSFVLTVVDGVKQLDFTSSTYSVNIDVQAIGVKGDCVFMESTSRILNDV